MSGEILLSCICDGCREIAMKVNDLYTIWSLQSWTVCIGIDYQFETKNFLTGAGSLASVSVVVMMTMIFIHDVTYSLCFFTESGGAGDD